MKNNSLEVDCSLFYRCGWCGHPTDENGAPIHIDDPGAYVGKMESLGAEESLLNGECCPNGDPFREPSREMLMDAGII